MRRIGVPAAPSTITSNCSDSRTLWRLLTNIALSLSSFVFVVVLLGVACVGMYASSEVYLDIVGNLAPVWLVVFMGLVLQLTRLRHPPVSTPTTAPLGPCVTSSFNFISHGR